MSNCTRIVTVVSTLLLSSAAFAANGDFSKIDANGDGKITLEEGMKLHPEWNESSFKALDADADGALNELEYGKVMATAPTPGQATTTADQPADAAANTNQSSSVKGKSGPATYLDANGPNDVLASKLIGMRIYAVNSDIDESKTYPKDSRKDWDDVGEVNDVVLNWDGSIKAVVLGVGGFLGIGERDVAIEMSSLRKVREADDSNDWFLVVNSTKDLISKAPPYDRKPKT